MWRVYPWLAIACMLCACGDEKQPAIATERTSELRIALVGVASNLDPIEVSSLYDFQVALNIFETPLRYKYLAQPIELTTSLAAKPLDIDEDATRFVLQLRSDSRFADAVEFPGGVGREVTATDVVYSFKRQLNPINRSRSAWLWRDYLAGVAEWVEAGANYDEPLAGVVALDEHTVQFTMTKPYPEFPHTLTHPASAVVAREIVENRGEDFNLNPNGSGPFKLISIDNTRALLDQNPNFPGTKLHLTEEGYDPQTQKQYDLESLDGQVAPFVDQLAFEFIPDATARWTAFTQGDIDIASVPSAQAKQLIVNTDPLVLSGEASNWHAALNLSPEIVYVTFNHEHPALADKNLRCALKYAQDWQQRNEVLHSGVAVYSEGIIPPYISGDYTSPPRANIDLAKRYLAKSETQDAALELSLVGTQEDRYFFEMWRTWLEAIGYDADKLSMRSHGRFGSLLEAQQNGEVMITTTAWTLDVPDSMNVLQLFYGSNSPAPNRSRYMNPAFDRLFEEASIGGYRREEYTAQMNDLLLEECALAGSLARRTLFAWSKDVAAYFSLGLNAESNWRFFGEN